LRPGASIAKEIFRKQRTVKKLEELEELSLKKETLENSER
tara:strand:+ start:408 stop:527 length:120 start_codon:yes stop_codon:yes gene_type:complete